MKRHFLYSYQQRIHTWGCRVFGIRIMRDQRERALRVLEESCELAQACGIGLRRAEQVLESVYERNPGEVRQELAGVLVTTLSLATSIGLVAERALQDELTRLEKPETIGRCRARQAEKAKAGLGLAPAPEEDA